MITRLIKLGSRSVLVYSRLVWEKVLIDFHCGWNSCDSCNIRWIRRKNQLLYLAQGPMLKFPPWYRSRCPNDKPARPCTILFEEDWPGDGIRQPPSSSSFVICTVRTHLSTGNTVHRPGFIGQKKKKKKNYYHSSWKKIDLKILPEFSHEQPSSVQVATVAVSLPFLVARKQMLRAEKDAIRTLAHHGKPVRSDLRRGNRPRRAAPSLILHVGDLPAPTGPGVEFSGQGFGIVSPPHRIHSVNLCRRTIDRLRKASIFS